jgi:hypothetical protein
MLYLKVRIILPRHTSTHTLDWRNVFVVRCSVRGMVNAQKKSVKECPYLEIRGSRNPYLASLYVSLNASLACLAYSARSK